MVDVSIILARVWKELSWAVNFVDNTIVLDLPLLELITMQVYVQPRVVRATEYILDRIPEFDLQESDECRPVATYPFVSDKNAARLDTNLMSPVPREPVDTIVERTGKKLRAVLFDGESPSPDVSRTVHIAHEHITKPWKSQLKYKTLYRNRNVQQNTSVPVSAHRRNQFTSIRWSGPHAGQVPTHKHFHSSSQRHYGYCPICTSEDDPRLRCWHFWSRGAVEAHRHIPNVIHIHTRCIR